MEACAMNPGCNILVTKMAKAAKRKVRYQVTARDKDGNIVSRNIRFTSKNATKLKMKTKWKKGVKTVRVETVK